MRLTTLLLRLAGISSMIGGLGVGLLILHITLDVVTRSVMNMPISGTILAVSTIYMPLIVFLPLAFTETRDGHITVELLYDLLPQAVRRVFDVIGHAVSITVFGLLAFRGWTEAGAKFAIGAAEMEGSMRIPVWPGYYLLPIGYGLIMLVLLLRLATALTGRPDPFTARTPGAKEIPDV